MISLLKHLLKLVLIIPVSPTLLSQPTYPLNPVTTADHYFLSGGGLARIDRSTGAIDWHVTGVGQLHAPVLGDNSLLTGGTLGVYAIDKSDGHIRWRRDLGSSAFSPVLNKGLAYVTTRDGRLLALSEKDGRVQWSRNLSEGWVYPPALEDGVLVTGGRDSRVWGLDALSGKPRWQSVLDQEMVYSPISAANHRVIVTTFSGRVLALDTRDGSEIWSRQFSSPSLAPAVIGGRVLLPGMDGVLRALHTDNGHLLWTQPLDSRPAQPLQGHDSLLMALTEEGQLYWLDAESGEIRFRKRIEGSPLGFVFLESNAATVILAGGNKSDFFPVLVNVDR
ncbi:MAG: PQQ-binding-like beta-propeller repeat protein [Gammaproteobacteria bacterium]|nr:PQQ-binding-like beta-propeller repeat protein [Gammaproteobacteria bacterium]